jgi:cell division protease FtsH
MPGAGNPNYSSDTSREIDNEVRQIIDNAYQQASTILQDNMDILHAMKDALMEYETLDSDQVSDLMARRKVRPPHDWHDDVGSSSSGKSDSPGSAGSVGDPAADH